MKIVCTKGHKVDHDEVRNVERSATIGMGATAVRQLEKPADASDAWKVLWKNGAWGFYSDEELREVAENDRG